MTKLSEQKINLGSPKDFIFIILGTLIHSFAFVMFIKAQNLPVAGLVGLATAINHLTTLPVGTIYFVLNIPVYLIAYKLFDVNFLMRTCLCTIVQSVSIDLFGVFLPVFTGDKMLASLYGGVLTGIGLGLIHSHNSTIGGSDLLAKFIYSKTSRLSLGNINITMNIIVILTYTVICYPLNSINDIMEAILYAIVIQVATFFVLDAYLTGMDKSNVAFIITKKPEEVSDEIMRTMNRGLTAIDSVGTYSKEHRTTLLCAVRSRDVITLKKILQIADPDCFMILTNTKEILGHNFKNLAKR